MDFNHLKRQVARLWRLHALRDPRERTVRRWYLDRGDRDLRYRYTIEPSDVVVDVGGYKGDYAAAIREKFGCKVIVFEPHPAFAAALRTRFAEDGKVQVVACGLAGQDAVMSLSDAADASSTEAISGLVLEVPMRQAATCFAELGVGAVALMKVNIEGGEFDLLPHFIESGFINRIDNLQVQFHDFVPDAAKQREAIRRAMLRTHDLAWDYPFVWESWRRRDMKGASPGDVAVVLPPSDTANPLRSDPFQSV